MCGVYYYFMSKKNNTPHKVLLNDEVLNLSVNVVKNMLELNSANNVVYNDKTISYHLLNAFVSKTSVSNVSDICDDALCKGTIRYRLRNIDLDEIQQSLNEKLKIHTIKTRNRKRIDLAIDYTNKSCCGNEKNDGNTIKTKSKQETSRFFTYTSIYAIVRNKHYTLAVKYVRKGETLKDTIDFLIKEIEAIGFKIKTLFLDKEFYTIEVINISSKQENTFYHTLYKKRT